MTRERLEKRIEYLTAEKERLAAGQIAVMGAIEDCKYWLKQLESLAGEQAGSPA